MQYQGERGPPPQKKLKEGTDINKILFFIFKKKFISASLQRLSLK